MIKELIKLANHLDRIGRTKEADYLDGIMTSELGDFSNLNDTTITPEDAFSAGVEVCEHKVESGEKLFSHHNEPEVGQIVENINPGCKHFGSKGEVLSLGGLDDDRGTVAVYLVSNTNDETYKPGDVLEKTLDQLQLIE
jgi:hypothetical protein